MLADATPLKTVVEIGAKDFGTAIKVCNAAAGERPVTGRFNFRNSADVAGLLLEKGFPVSFDGVQLNVGCDQASAELAGGATGIGVSATSPFAAAIVGGSRPQGYVPELTAPGAAPSYGPPPPPAEPPKYQLENIRYREPGALIAILAKLPGLSVIADPKVPGPLLLSGPASIVNVASKYLAELDVCPAQVQIEAAVISSSITSGRSRAFGVQLHAGNSTLIGGPISATASTISIPSLRVFLDGLAEGSEFRVNSSLKSRVLLGETVTVQDGQDVPIRAATSVTDRETRQDVIYRSVGHQMTVKLLAMYGADAILSVEHELSSQTGNSSLGPVFTNRTITSTMRVRIGSSVMVSLSGADSASKLKSRGIFSRSDATEAAKAGAFLVFALERLPCGAGPGSERSEERKPEPRGETIKASPKRK